MKTYFVFGLVFCTLIIATEVFGQDDQKELIYENSKGSKQLGLVRVNETLEATYPNLHLILVNPQDKSQTISFKLQNLTSIHSNSWYNPMKQTAIYIFGFTENIIRPTTQTILDAYIKRGGHNILVIDWSAYNGVTSVDYPVAIENMKIIGEIIGSRIAATFRSFLTMRFHLVGHSLGAHLAAYINRGIPKSFFTPQIPKIIGLDPAGPY